MTEHYFVLSMPNYASLTNGRGQVL